MHVLPLPAFLFTLIGLTLASWYGATRFTRLRSEVTVLREEFGVIQGATLTLLGLIVGFTFSMALDRYEQRKDFEAAESAAIATAWLRADLLPAEDAGKLRAVLSRYLEQRVNFFSTRLPSHIAEATAGTARLQAELWTTVTAPALANPSPLTALVVTSVNQVINSAGDTQAAWHNRIPGTAWLLMVAIAIFATLLVGIGLEGGHGFQHMLVVLPLVIATAFFLIADIESPRMGIIRVVPDNLEALSESLHGPE